MHVSLDKPQPPSAQKVKNILIRSSYKDKFHPSLEHPERSYILKYAPKYYKSLNIEIDPYSPLLSKIKKIKKLKKLRGQTRDGFREILPQNLWFNLLANGGKEIEEIPEILGRNSWEKWSQSFWRRLSVQRIKHFSNVRRVSLETWRIDHSEPFLSPKEFFARYIWYLRRLRYLEIPVRDKNYEETRWVFEKLNGMKELLEKLETLIISVIDLNMTRKELLENKNLFSHVTGLNLMVPFDATFAEIPNICKSLKSLSLNFCEGVNGAPEFGHLLTSIQHLDQLRSFKCYWPKGARDFWGHFKPQSSLRELRLEIDISELFGKNIEHWEEIQELDYLELNFECYSPEETLFVKQFSTMLLKKVQKLHSLKYILWCRSKDDAPFSVEEVPHLYDSLKKFEYYLSSESPSTVDLKMMEPFKCMKELKLEGDDEVTYKNVEKVVTLLEENQKEGETSVLEINMKITKKIFSNFADTLEKINEIKRDDKNVKILFEIRYDYVPCYSEFNLICEVLQIGSMIKGLEVHAFFEDDESESIAIGAYWMLLEKMHNVRIKVMNVYQGFLYTKVDGEKKKFEEI